MNYSNQELYFEQIEFIQNILKNFSTGKRLIIFMHHPPFIDKKDILKMGSDSIHDKDISYWMFEEKIYTDFFNLFNNHNVEYIFTGHLHINLETKFNDTKIISTSAVGVPLGDHCLELTFFKAIPSWVSVISKIDMLNLRNK